MAIVTLMNSYSAVQVKKDVYDVYETNLDGSLGELKQKALNKIDMIKWCNTH